MDSVFHQFGTKLDSIGSAHEAIRAAGLDWTVSLRPVYVDGREVNNHNAIVRDDSEEVLGWCANRYHPIQNKDVFNFFDEAITDDVRYVAAGSSKLGKIVWLVAKTPVEHVVFPGDSVKGYILLASSHNGSLSVTVQYMPIRTLCSNVVSGIHKRASFKVRHTRGYRSGFDQAHDALGLVRGSLAKTADVARTLLRRRVGDTQVAKVVKAAFGIKGDAEKSQHFNAIREVLHHEETCNTGKMAGTGWALYNAVTFYLDHQYKGRNTAMYRSVFGRGNSIRKKAYKAIVAGE